MEVIVSARHFEVGDDLRGYAENKVMELAGEHTKLTTARVVLDVQRNVHEAEIHLNGKHVDLVATARTNDMYASLDGAVEKLEKQLRKHIEKMQDHRSRLEEKFEEEEESEALGEGEAETVGEA